MEKGALVLAGFAAVMVAAAHAAATPATPAPSPAAAPAPAPAPAPAVMLVVASDAGDLDAEAVRAAVEHEIGARPSRSAAGSGGRRAHRASRPARGELEVSYRDGDAGRSRAWWRRRPRAPT